MANDQQVAKIRDALKQLDPTNDDHWTDDGQPKTGVVQRIANDQTIKRQDIQLAAPQFQRPALDASGEPVDPAGISLQQTAGVGGDPTPPADLTQGDGEFMTEDEVREELDRRVGAAGDAVAAAQKKIKDGNAELIAARKALQEANADRNRAFPPMTAAENVKQHIEGQNLLRAARVAGHMGSSQLDLAMRRGNSRGWRRPTRSVLGVQAGAVGGAVPAPNTSR